MINPKSAGFALIALAAVLVPPGRAQFIQVGGKLAGTGAAVGFAAQGSSVAVSGDDGTAAIAGNSENAVWIFTRSNGDWTQQGAKIPLSGCSGPASPGCQVALSEDGNTLLVGAPFDNQSAGSARVFVRAANGTWSQQGNTLSGNDAVGASEQGYGVALSADGNTAVVGGALDNSGAGAVWVFTRDGNGAWSQHGRKLVGSGAVGPAWQGFSVAISGDGSNLLSGGPFDANFAGATWVFHKDANGDWTQQGPKLVGSGAAGPAFQGQSVSMSATGSTALIGAPQDNMVNRVSVGAAWVFRRHSDGTWAQEGNKLVANDFAGVPRQGQSVALSGAGTTAVVGGPFDDGAKGAIWIYTRDNNGVWTQQGGKLVGAGSVGGVPEQGQSVAISESGSTILTGGPGDNNDLGAAWAFSQIHFQVNAPATAAPGVPFNFSVTVADANNLPLPGYTGTVHFSSSDPTATLPADSSLVSIGGSFPTDVPIFAATLRTAGFQTINVTDTKLATLTAASGAIAVGDVATNVTHFGIIAPATATAGTAFSASVIALDPADRVVENYAGTVHFSSSDAAATLPANLTLANGRGTFDVTLRSAGVQAISAIDVANGTITGTSIGIVVSATATPPVPQAVGPATGHATSATFIFTFNDPRGAQDLGVLNVLINDALDGRHACYLAYSRPLNVLYLLDDNGNLNPQNSGSLNSDGSVSNSQCMVSWGQFATGTTGSIFQMQLNIAFRAGFAGNKVIFMAARDVAERNSGWQALGVWQVPGAIQTTPAAVTGMTPPHGIGLSPTPFSFGFSDTQGFPDLQVLNILVNDTLDGRHACYLAYARANDILYLVNDNGDGLLPGQPLASAGTLANSQCTVAWDAGAAIASGNNLTLNLRIGFRAGFAGNRIFFLAARGVLEANNSGWQASGTWTVQ